MKDGFDRSVAEKMPKIQKKRPNRPWNVDPVLMKVNHEDSLDQTEAVSVQAVEEQDADIQVSLDQSGKQDQSESFEIAAAEATVAAAEISIATAADDPEEFIASVVDLDPLVGKHDVHVDTIGKKALENRNSETIIKAVDTIKELNAEFNQILFDRKEIQHQLKKSSSAIEEVAQENSMLKASLAEVEKNALDNSLIEREIDFLNEQLEDADFFIQNMVGLLEEKEKSFDQEAMKRKDLEARLQKVSKEIQEKAKMDVKISILEKDLSISSTRIFELETKLEEEYQKREPLELEIVELKNALDRVYSSLSHIRLKAKREVYGS